MSERANVTSLEALEAFRAALIIYHTRANLVLDDVGQTVAATRLWLEGDRRAHWEGERRRRAHRLAEAKQNLLSARMSDLRVSASFEHLEVQKAERAVREAEDKVRRVRRWAKQYENRAAPLARGVDKLRQYLSDDINKAIASLGRTIDTLHAYIEIPAPSTPDPTGEDDA
jgi:hypothetical protein